APDQHSRYLRLRRGRCEPRHRRRSDLSPRGCAASYGWLRTILTLRTCTLPGNGVGSRPLAPAITLMTDVRSDPNLQRRQDERELGALGYAQELFRTIGGFSN